MTFLFNREFFVKTFFVLFLTLILSACSSVPEQSSGGVSGNSVPEIERVAKAVTLIDPGALKEYQEAMGFIKQGDLTHANTLLTNIVAKYPDLPAPLFNLGLIAERNNDLSGATSYYKRAVDVDSSYHLALNNLGLIARTKGDFNEALIYYTKGLNIAPNSPDLHFNAGVLNEIYLHDYARAIAHYEHYISLAASSQSGETKDVSSWIKDLKRRSR